MLKLGNVPLNILLERLSERRDESELSDSGSEPENWLTARERFCKNWRRERSGERVPVRLSAERLREMTWR